MTKSLNLVKADNGFLVEDPGESLTVYTTFEDLTVGLANIFGDNQVEEKPKKKDEEAGPETKTEDDKPAKKAAKKKSKKKEPAPEPEDTDVEEVDEDDLTLDHVRTALRDYAADHGKDAAKSVIENVGGVKIMADIPTDKFSVVILACEEAPEDDM